MEKCFKMLTSVDFFEKYKEVDTYCREKHNLENGIKEYIDAMYDFRREGRQIQDGLTWVI